MRSPGEPGLCPHTGTQQQVAFCVLAAIRRAALVKACMALRRATLSKDRPPYPRCEPCGL